MSTISTIIPPLVLRVGSNLFYTNRVTLTEKSAYFRALLGPDFASPFQADGSLFIDSDGDVFTHILTYLRHGIMPVFFDEEHGHDKQMYRRVLDQAKYFQVQEIVDWIEEKGYEDDQKDVTVTYSSEVVSAVPLDGRIIQSGNSTSTVQEVKSIGVFKVYLCANGQPVGYTLCKEDGEEGRVYRKYLCQCRRGFYNYCTEAGKNLRDSATRRNCFLSRGKLSPARNETIKLCRARS